ncbi:glycosyltransferase family 4 protein [Sodalis sp. RH24]|uniref:glycosyltransferase family 4 protein n=1 Tax=unclassified Sodalis (in: enterobacteria) TaxID=2636512 RepID=UPI0039B4A5CF
MNKDISEAKIAIIHDWLVNPGGGEKVLGAIIKAFPTAQIYTMVDFLSNNDRSFLLSKNVKTSIIQKFPFAKQKYRAYLPFMTFAVEQIDLSEYDIILSSSHAVAKGVITGPNQLHICYCHSPIRYAWDMQHQYLKESNLANKKFKGLVARWLLHKIRIWDYRTAAGVDYFIANSKYIAKRIKKVYGRKADVIYPNVAINDFDLVTNKEDYYFTASRMVPYKKIDLIVEAFKSMPDKKLIVIGDGPQFNKINQLAGENVQLLGYQSFEILSEKMGKAKAFIFAAEEDFGIIPLEAQACGTPVIAFGRGGALETVIPYDSNSKSEPTGVFFEEQSTDALIAAINYFEKISDKISPHSCRKNAEKFSEERFTKEYYEYVETKWVLFLQDS